MKLIGELKRRKLFRVATIYVVGAWLILQVCDVLFPGWGIPEDAIRFVVYAAAAGFPVALVIGWKYDITVDGIVRTASGAGLESPALGGRDYALLAGLLLVFIVVSWNILQRVAENPASAAPESSMAKAELDPRAVAILPFSTVGGGDDNLLAEGLHQDLMTRVIKVASLSVIADTSVGVYRGSDKALGTIARELGVGRILTGAVQQAGDRIRVNVQLVDALNDRSLWGDVYDRVLDADNVFDIQADVAEQVARALEAEVTPQEERRLVRQPTRDFAAYQALLRGNVALKAPGTESLEIALGHYERALEIEPDYAQAYLAMAKAYVEYFEYRGLTFEESRQRVIEYTARAIELDEGLGEAYRLQGAVVRDLGDFQAGLDILLRGLEVEPGNGRLHHVVGLTLRMQGRPDEAMPYYDRALELDPLSPIVNESRGSALRDAARFEEAEKQYRLTMELAPSLSTSYWGMGTLRWSQGRPAEAVSWFRQALERAPLSAAYATCEALMFLEMGLDDRVETWVESTAGQQLPAAGSDYLLPAGYLAVYRGQPRPGPTDLRDVLPEYWYGGVVSLPPASLLAGDDLAALAELEREFPGLVSGDTSQDGTNFREAVMLAWLLDRLGDRPAARRLLDETEAWIADKPRLGIRGYWVTDAQIAVIRGDRAAAMASLRTAVDAGWRHLWRYFLLHDPILAELRDESGYQELVERVRSDMQAQAAHLVPETAASP